MRDQWICRVCGTANDQGRTRRVCKECSRRARRLWIKPKKLSAIKHALKVEDERAKVHLCHRCEGYTAETGDCLECRLDAMGVARMLKGWTGAVTVRRYC